MDGAAKDETLPPGFRFHPTDEELITYHLTHKMSDAKFNGRAIADVDLNKCEPWDLPSKAKMGEKEWYFFNLRDRKYPTGLRTNRATNAGYWKTTGKDKEIFNSNTLELVGMKKTLVFYKGRAPRGEKTNWVMHEYRAQSKNGFKTPKDEWVVCRIFHKSSSVKKFTTTHLQSRSNNYHMVNMGPTNMVYMGPAMQVDMGQFGHAEREGNAGNAELAELNRALRGGPTGGMVRPMQPQLNHSPNFTLTGINVNMGALPAPMNQHMVPPGAAPQPVMVQPNDHANGLGLCPETRFRNMDTGLDLDGYWAPY